MQVRASDTACGTDLAKGLPCRQHIPQAALHAREVAVHGEQAAAMVQPHSGAVEKVIPNVYNGAGQWRHDAGAGGRCNVHSAVGIA